MVGDLVDHGAVPTLLLGALDDRAEQVVEVVQVAEGEAAGALGVQHHADRALAGGDDRRAAFGHLHQRRLFPLAVDVLGVEVASAPCGSDRGGSARLSRVQVRPQPLDRLLVVGERVASIALLLR